MRRDPVVWAVALLALAGCVFVGAEEGQGTPAPKWLEPTDEVVSPHVAWAKPDAAGPMRVLFITYQLGMREVVELCQRFDIEREVFAVYANDLRRLSYFSPIEGVPLPPGYDHSLYGLYRHFSSDGIHWRVEGDPLAGHPETKQAYGGKPFVSSDGLAIFQLADGTYVCHNKVQLAAPPGGYVRNDVGRGECRTVARRESPDGWEWVDTYEIILTPDWLDPADTQFMDVMMNEYNGGYIGFATVYHAAESTVDLQLAGSTDDRKWWRPVRRPCVSLEPLGDIGGGILWPFRGFVIDGDQVHLYYTGVRGLHGDIYSDHGRTNPPHEGAFCRASWKLGRMWAALHHAGNDETAWLTTRPMATAGKTLTINALTRGSGAVEAELYSGTQWQADKPIPGYTRAECNAFHGDQTCTTLTWKDHERISVDNALIRLYLTDAFLYGFDLR